MKHLEPSDLPVTRSASPTAAADPTALGTDPFAPSFSAARPRDPERYAILGEHGRGGLGRVSRAHDRELGRDVAIKELISRGPIGEIRFLREALITARLEHPGIVPVHEAGRWPDGTPFYAMKLVAGRALRELIAERGTTQARLALLPHVIAVADAIAYAHRRGVIHRDLKPANVIVGEFGETVVIDWGLAKDLSDPDAPDAGEPGPASGDLGLTVAGSVLGTPAYMAPEQARGEPVDRRADVFAIGAMLWELCALPDLELTDVAERRRALRRAGIAPDLIAILDRALAEDPAERYADAGALAADLKAFDAGARIGSRDYSVLDVIVHWARRHRWVALAIAAAIALAATGAAMYVQRITVERDHVRAANATLTLGKAELLMATDPTEAFELLDAYQGPDRTRQAMLRAQARGLGVARLHVTPHALSIYFATALRDGSVVTLGGDESIAKTSLLGVTRVIARDVNHQYTLAYDRVGHLLAYACRGTAVCVLDVERERPAAAPAEAATFSPEGLAFSPSGALLAAISARGDLAIWRRGGGGAWQRTARASLVGGDTLELVDEVTLVARFREHVQLFHLDATGGVVGAPAELLVPGANDLRSNAALKLVAISTVAGELVVIDIERAAISQRAPVCKGSLNRAIVLASRSQLGYACQEGTVGTWDLTRRIAKTLTRITSGALRIEGSADDRLVMIGAGDGAVVICDLVAGTSRSLLGHTVAITAIVPPTPDDPFLLTGDSFGAIRAWSASPPVLQVALETTTRLSRAALLAHDGPLIAIGQGPTIPWRTRERGGEVAGHRASHHWTARSLAKPEIAMYGVDDEVEAWSFVGTPSRRILRSRGGPVSTLAYTADGSELMIASRDGTIEAWSTDRDDHRVVASVHEPAVLMSALPAVGSFVVAGASGALWRLAADHLTYLGREPGPLTMGGLSPDGRWLAIAGPDGVVSIRGIGPGPIFTTPALGARIQHFEFSPDSREVIVSAAQATWRFDVPDLALHRADPDWAKLDMLARWIRYSDGGMWLALVADHGVWLQRRATRAWHYVPAGGATLNWPMFSGDERQLVIADSSGRALVIDLTADNFVDH